MVGWVGGWMLPSSILSCNLPSRDLPPRLTLSPTPCSWVAEEWSACSKSCGKLGLQVRAVQCVQRLRDGTNRTLHAKYCSAERPETRRPCSRLPCPAQWRTGAWSQVNDVGMGLCAWAQSCHGGALVVTHMPCFSPWAQCSASCGDGVQQRQVVCRGEESGGRCHGDKPEAIRGCHVAVCLGESEGVGTACGVGSLQMAADFLSDW